ncbi:MAG: peptidoglycan DD-metalloendopeptidase family protein [Rhodothermaceae bacterium]|nr:peptidoglycan DD-metalloendopeptidase family protein [Rhodothermaceae bacterium]MXZ17154.1 peptidoglycan DD-metalloendopeptidase family protein [Rhodothermaceae bacterium]MYC05330.1 peptidoglycan DD-metalloendopeptidase family protein [Rhodothermaceae bacterium]MYG68999.1 peptidoglycan DD-metalloendopeptidase family protein [Rhodothermaceae bacterium]MYI18239.1 peptidoglycan DD-metalloendopeptidase family protein [Rhodothermaceae bacterium]
MWENIKRFYICLGVLAIVQLPINPETETGSSASAEVKRNQFDLAETGLIEHTSEVKRGESLGSIMSEWGISQDKIHLASQKAASFVDLRKIQRGNPLYTYTDSIKGTTSFIVYQPSVERFLVFDLRDSILVHEGVFPVSKISRTASGTIESSLYQAVTDAELPGELAMKLSEIFAWQISFFHLQPGDDFSIVYEDHIVNGQSIETDIRGARMNHEGKEFFAFYFPSDSVSGFYDETGHALKRPFLRAPIEYTRISSRYSLSRFHPVQKRYKPHLGTDFAAPTGTPIVATADGSVTHASYTGGNGNYVRIRHNDVYSTGYLHMSRIANGIRPGVRVEQGQLIGYVGSTGIATGPHVCYRFWENGRQVDAMRVEMPPSEPLSESLLPQFTQIISELKPQLTPPSTTAAASAVVP